MINKLKNIEKKIDSRLDSLSSSINELLLLIHDDDEFTSKDIARNLRSHLIGNGVYNFKQVRRDLDNLICKAKMNIKKGQ